MIIIFLDINKQHIEIFNSNGSVIVPFSKIDTLKDINIDEPVYYITDAIETSIDEIINMVYSIEGVEEVTNKVNNQNNKIYSNNQYIHSSENKNIIIDENFYFRGRYDIKLIDDNLKKSIQSNKKVQQMINKGYLEIIDEQQKQKVLKEMLKEQEEKDKKQEEKDKKIDEMVLDKPVSDFLENPEENEDYLTINLDNEGRNFVSEEEKLIRGLGIKE